MTFGGTVKNVDGNTYTVEDYEGNQVKLCVGQGTKQIQQEKGRGHPSRRNYTRRLREFYSVTLISNPRTHLTRDRVHERAGPDRPARSLCATTRNKVIEPTPSPISER